MIEIVGTIASVIVAISLTLKNIKWLRIINGVGACAFAVYGFFIQAWPVFGLNAFITVIDVFYLIQMYKKRDLFDIFDTEIESSYVQSFLHFYRDDIKKYFPHFTDENGLHARIILRDVIPAALILYRLEGHVLKVIVDYATPSYRDTKSGEYFYSNIHDRYPDIESVEAVASVPAHESYLQGLGFSREKEGFYIRKL